ncbi:hypothetical protein BGY98DRAFT_1180249 [Russula aff. rugulosa BPL654]|nr:hypothetical protein BGY98DRAFT_1180249 [Russula aff. rugulosa BPL654]
MSEQCFSCGCGDATLAKCVSMARGEPSKGNSPSSSKKTIRRAHVRDLDMDAHPPFGWLFFTVGRLLGFSLAPSRHCAPSPASIGLSLLGYRFTQPSPPYPMGMLIQPNERKHMFREGNCLLFVTRISTRSSKWGFPLPFEFMSSQIGYKVLAPLQRIFFLAPSEGVNSNWMFGYNRDVPLYFGTKLGDLRSCNNIAILWVALKRGLRKNVRTNGSKRKSRNRPQQSRRGHRDRFDSAQGLAGPMCIIHTNASTGDAVAFRSVFGYSSSQIANRAARRENTTQLSDLEPALLSTYGYIS